MKKILLFLFTVLFIISGICFFITLNLNLSLSGADKLKKIAKEGNFYSIAANYIKNDVVDKSGLELDKGSNFEKLNQEINSNTVKDSVDQTIDRFYEAVKSDQPDYTFNIVFAAENGYTFSKLVNLHDNGIFLALRSLPLVVALWSLLTILFLAAIFLLSGKAKQKFKFIGWSFVSLALILVGIYCLISYANVPAYFDFIVGKTNFFVDSTLQNGLRKVVSSAFSGQRFYYLVEAVILIALSSILFYISKMLSWEKLERIDDKI